MNMAQPLPLTNRCHKCGEWFHNVHVCAEDCTKLKQKLPEHLRWKGEGPPPARWTAADETIVYRSYADYVMD